MIPKAYITEWKKESPWNSDYQVEQDLIIEKALVGISGYGGGHEHACGACVKVEDFNQFIDNFKKELNIS